MAYRLALISLFCLLPFQAHSAASTDLKLGSIVFETSAGEEAQEKFILGVKALHCFWYEQARQFFQEAQALDPAFGMAYWGEAMSYDNALGTMPNVDYEKRGEQVLARMEALDAAGSLRWNVQERYWYEAIRQRYAPNTDIAVKRRNYGRAMEGMVEMYPQVDEVQVFAALALMSFPGFDREQAGHVVLAAAPLEAIYERNPDHPGVLHYLIHAYDTPTFAPLALRQARRFGEIAASAPHAVHMPSHIYKHLGMWDDMLLANVTSWLVSVEWQESTGRPVYMRDFHTFGWLLDTYLILGEQERAAQLMADLDAMEQAIADRGEKPDHFPATAAALRQRYATGELQADH